MTFKRFDFGLLFRVILLFLTLCGAAWLLIKEESFVLFAVLILLAIIEVISFYNLNKKSQSEMEQFVESVHYRDFSRYFDEKHAPVDLQPMRKGFNEINSTFKLISREKETQYQYLQKILELVDTGIISYEVNSGELAWMNESLKKMLGVPYLKAIQSLSKRDAKLFEEIKSIKPGESRVVDLHSDLHTVSKTLLSATAFQTDGKIYKLIAFQNVNEALDENESKAWQKLLSVMTHEIMNSVAPISSLADTLKNRLQEATAGIEKRSGTIEDMEVGIDTIKRRSEGLMKFAEVYRNLNKITSLNVKKIYVRNLFENLNRLMQPTLEQKKINLEIVLKDPDLAIDADANLIEQVLINLVVNAIDAVKDKEQPRIVLSAYYAINNKPVIKVADNGMGISDEVLDKIFVPFFSTKKNGSGIGLSLCKQIMMLHKGNIQVQSIVNEGTALYLSF